MGYLEREIRHLVRWCLREAGPSPTLNFRLPQISKSCNAKVILFERWSVMNYSSSMHHIQRVLCVCVCVYPCSHCCFFGNQTYLDTNNHFQFLAIVFWMTCWKVKSLKKSRRWSRWKKGEEKTMISLWLCSFGVGEKKQTTLATASWKHGMRFIPSLAHLPYSISENVLLGLFSLVVMLVKIESWADFNVLSHLCLSDIALQSIALHIIGGSGHQLQRPPTLCLHEYA